MKIAQLIQTPVLLLCLLSQSGHLTPVPQARLSAYRAYFSEAAKDASANHLIVFPKGTSRMVVLQSDGQVLIYDTDSLKRVDSVQMSKSVGSPATPASLRAFFQSCGFGSEPRQQGFLDEPVGFDAYLLSNENKNILMFSQGKNAGITFVPTLANGSPFKRINLHSLGFPELGAADWLRSSKHLKEASFNQYWGVSADGFARRRERIEQSLTGNPLYRLTVASSALLLFDTEDATRVYSVSLDESMMSHNLVAWNVVNNGATASKAWQVSVPRNYPGPADRWTSRSTTATLANFLIKEYGNFKYVSVSPEIEKELLSTRTFSAYRMISAIGTTVIFTIRRSGSADPGFDIDNPFLSFIGKPPTLAEFFNPPQAAMDFPDIVAAAFRYCGLYHDASKKRLPWLVDFDESIEPFDTYVEHKLKAIGVQRLDPAWYKDFTSKLSNNVKDEGEGKPRLFMHLYEFKMLTSNRAYLLFECSANYHDPFIFGGSWCRIFLDKRKTGWKVDTKASSIAGE